MVCGKEFTAYKSIAQRSLYCHPNCRQKAIRLKREGVFNHKIKAIEYIGYEDVYNLYVPDVHNFACEGIIVSNCDSLRYLVMARMDGADLRIPEKPIPPDSPWGRYQAEKKKKKQRRFKYHAKR